MGISRKQRDEDEAVISRNIRKIVDALMPLLEGMSFCYMNPRFTSFAMPLYLGDLKRGERAERMMGLKV